MLIEDGSARLNWKGGKGGVYIAYFGSFKHFCVCICLDIRRIADVLNTEGIGWGGEKTNGGVEKLCVLSLSLSLSLVFLFVIVFFVVFVFAITVVTKSGH